MFHPSTTPCLSGVRGSYETAPCFPSLVGRGCRGGGVTSRPPHPCPLPPETVSQRLFCHSAQAQSDAESSIFRSFWMPAFAGMTISVQVPDYDTVSRGRGRIVVSFLPSITLSPEGSVALNEDIWLAASDAWSLRNDTYVRPSLVLTDWMMAASPALLSLARPSSRDMTPIRTNPATSKA